MITQKAETFARIGFFRLVRTYCGLPQPTLGKAITCNQDLHHLSKLPYCVR
nr:MAG TPA: hypothetical protein [Caudoviricetes sp.]